MIQHALSKFKVGESHAFVRLSTDREPGSDSGSEAVGSSVDWLLQPAPLGQSDDEALFEVALRLRHSTEPGIALPALQQLTHAWMVDLPAEAIVLQHGILVSCTCLDQTSSLCKSMRPSDG